MRSPAWIRRVRPLAGIFLACGVAACSLLTSLDGLTGGAGSDSGTGAAAPDGTAPGDAASGGTEDTGSVVTPGADGGDDATSSLVDSSAPAPDGSHTGTDASTDAKLDSNTDAGTDASPHDAAPPPYCASLSPAPLFCDDFDEGALATPWDQVTGTNGTASLDSTFSVSPPDAMLASVTASAPGGNVDVAGYKSFTAKQGVAGVYTFSFELRIDAADTASAADAVLGAIQLWNGTSTWDLELEVAYGGAAGVFDVFLTENSSTDYAQHATSAQLSLHTWARVSLAITLPVEADAGDTTHATLSFNGAEVASATVHVTTTEPPIPEILLGPTYATAATTGWAVRYDNVTFD